MSYFYHSLFPSFYLKQMVDESNTVTMEQANISALMDALQSAGYQIGHGNQQIIINADGHAMVVDQQVRRVSGWRKWCFESAAFYWVMMQSRGHGVIKLCC